MPTEPTQIPTPELAVASDARLDAGLARPGRLAALAATGLLERGTEPGLDRFARLACSVSGAPVALVSLVTAERQHFAGLCGLAQPWADAREGPRSHTFCEHVVVNEAPLVVRDARRDPVLCDSPALVKLDAVAFAGFPIAGAAGDVLGCLCAIDRVPRAWDAAQLGALYDVAALVGDELERRELARRLALESRTDELTGLANRRAWEQELAGAVARAHRLGHALSIALLDLDRFGDFNERHGRAAGDDALCAVADRWRRHVRDIDVLARVGGGEFGLILPGSDGTDGLVAVNRLRDELPRGMSVSAGVAAWNAPMSVAQLVRRADRTLHRAMAEGRDRVLVTDGIADEPW